MAGDRRNEPVAGPVVGTWPALILVMAALSVLLLPMGDSPARQLMLPHLAIVPVVYLTLRDPEGMGPVGAFVAGLAVDVLTFGPLGVFAAGYLLVHALFRYGREPLHILPRLFRSLAFAAAAAFVIALTWVVLVASGAPPPRQVNTALAWGGLFLVGILFEVGLVLVDRRAAKAPGAGRAVLGPERVRPFRLPQRRRRRKASGLLGARRP